MPATHLPAHAGAAALPFFEAEARKRETAGQKAGGQKAGRGRIAGAPIGAPAIKHRAADDEAKAFNTSPRNIQQDANTPANAYM
jgi:hypothetical protein